MNAKGFEQYAAAFENEVDENEDNDDDDDEDTEQNEAELEDEGSDGQEELHNPNESGNWTPNFEAAFEDQVSIPVPIDAPPTVSTKNILMPGEGMPLPSSPPKTIPMVTKIGSSTNLISNPQDFEKIMKVDELEIIDKKTRQ
jgi:hypothetical protein